MFLTGENVRVAKTAGGKRSESKRILLATTDGIKKRLMIIMLFNESRSSTTLIYQIFDICKRVKLKYVPIKGHDTVMVIYDDAFTHRRSTLNVVVTRSRGSICITVISG